MHSPVISFKPIISNQAKLLILGSIPGIKSIQEQQYYAHPRNAFWKIMAALWEFDADTDYQNRLKIIQKHGVALWDVAHQCNRQGSLDSEIDRHSVIPNDISALLTANPSIQTICFNGQTAARMFKQHFPDLLKLPRFSFITLPSTSPAHASMTIDNKLKIWHIVKHNIHKTPIQS